MSAPPAETRPHPARQRLLFTALMVALPLWPLLHRAPSATCPPGVTSCPLQKTPSSADTATARAHPATKALEPIRNISPSPSLH